jgi:hypothetical protein
MGMSIKFRIVLSAALILGATTAVSAASKHPASKHPAHSADRTVQGNAGNAIPRDNAYRGLNAYGAYTGYNPYPGYNAYGFSYPAYNAYGAAGYAGYDAYAFDRKAANEAYDFYSNVSRGETYIWIQDKFFRQSNGF